jgi:hypothetical protein
LTGPPIIREGAGPRPKVAGFGPSASKRLGEKLTSAVDRAPHLQATHCGQDGLVRRSRMRSLGSLLLMVGWVSACSAAENPALASLCIDRPEQHGRVNITPVELSITPEDGRKAQLMFAAGGERKCADLPAGRASVVLRFPYPYGGPGEKPRYWARRASLVVAAGPNRAVLDTGKGLNPQAAEWEDTGWHDMWELTIRRE